MLKPSKSILVRVIALLLVFLLFTPVTTLASENSAIQPLASYYLDAYNTYIYDSGNGTIQIWYEVMGTGYMDEIGVLSIILYEVNSDGSLKRVKTFS